MTEKQTYHNVELGKHSTRRDYSKVSGKLELPNLVEIQTDSFKWFVEEGIKEGIIKGKKEGIKEGIREGVEQATNDHIIRMIKEDLDIKLISRITDKSEEEIIEIKKSL